MRRWQVEWTPWAIEHIANHDVEPDEVDQALRGRRTEQRERWGRRRILGRSAAGRYLAVVIVPQEQGAARLLSARDMTESERQLYRRRTQR